VTSVTIYGWWSRWKYIVSSVDHPGLDPVGLLVVVGGCYCTSSRHQYCTTYPLKCANPTIKGLRTQVDYMELGYDFTILLHHVLYV